MNKSEMIGLPAADRGIEVLSGKFSNKIIFVPGDQTLMIPKPYNIKDYFDLVIIDDIAYVDSIGHPDIFIYNKEEIDTGGVVDIQRVFELKSTLICINQKAAEQAKRLRLKPRNYMISLPSQIGLGINAKTFSRFVQSGNNENEDSKVLVGEKDFMSDFYGDGAPKSFDKYFKESDKYRVPLNMRSKNRKLLMETWG